MALKVGAAIFPVAVSLALTGFIPSQDQLEQSTLDERLKMVMVEADTALGLQVEFNALDYAWPPRPGSVVPRLELDQLPGDLDKLNNVKQKKALFFAALLPIVLAENELIAQARMRAKAQLEMGYDHLPPSAQAWLNKLAARYKVEGDLSDPAVQRALLTRVDVVPPALALAQAANESAWGSSRFARQGNNLFGQWTYSESKGLVPEGRPDGETYAVRVFDSVDASVRAYLLNLNTNPAYHELRRLRQEMRDAGQALDPHRLAHGLVSYSSRGEEYIAEIQSMMRTNRLISLLDGVRLQGGG